jgi:hypothetical protein
MVLPLSSSTCTHYARALDGPTFRLPEDGTTSIQSSLTRRTSRWLKKPSMTPRNENEKDVSRHRNSLLHARVVEAGDGGDVAR